MHRADSERTATSQSGIRASVLPARACNAAASAITIAVSCSDAGRADPPGGRRQSSRIREVSFPDRSRDEGAMRMDIDGVGKPRDRTTPRAR